MFLHLVKAVSASDYINRLSAHVSLSLHIVQLPQPQARLEAVSNIQHVDMHYSILY